MISIILQIPLLSSVSLISPSGVRTDPAHVLGATEIAKMNILFQENLNLSQILLAFILKKRQFDTLIRFRIKN